MTWRVLVTDNKGVGHLYYVSAKTANEARTKGREFHKRQAHKGTWAVKATAERDQ